MAQDSESHTRTVTGGGGVSAFFHDVEMRIEGRDFIDFGLRELHLGGKRGQVRTGDVAVLVLDQVQMLDQQVAAARSIGQQSLDVGDGLRIDLTAFRRAAGPIACPSDRRGRLLSDAHRVLSRP
jgi:hypothetical protein